MKTQYEKYKDNQNIHLVSARFQGGRQEYLYLFNSNELIPSVGDFGIILSNDNKYVMIEINNVAPASAMQPNPSFGKYGWILGAFPLDKLAEMKCDISIMESSDAGIVHPLVNTIKDSQQEEDNLLDRLF